MAEIGVHDATNFARAEHGMKSPSHRRLFRSIFALCAAVITVGCGGPPYPTRVVESERQAVEQLIGLGAGVHTDDSGHVIAVKFYFNPDRSNPAVHDSDIECLTKLKKIRRLKLNPTEVSNDEFLRTIPKLTELELLDVPYGTTDRGLEAVADLKSLKHLTLSSDLITDDGLRALSGLTELESLSLDSACVRGPGLKYLNGLQRLEHLMLSSLEVSSTDLNALNQLSSLRSLSISGAELDDQGLAAIRPTLTRLKVLQLGQTNLTDAGFDELKKLPNLRTLTLGGYCWQLAVNP